MFICIQKINIISNLFLGYCKDIASLLFWELWERLTIPIKNDSINLQETFMPICTQQINVITHFFVKILQRNSKLVILGNLGTPRPPKKLASTWRNLWCLSARKKSTSFFLFSLTYCKDIANLLLWELWAKYCLFWVLWPAYIHPKWY